MLTTPLGIFNNADCLLAYPRFLIKVAENVVMTPLGRELSTVIKHRSQTLESLKVWRIWLGLADLSEVPTPFWFAARREITASSAPRIMRTARREPKEEQAAVHATVMPQRTTLMPRTRGTVNF